MVGEALLHGDFQGWRGIAHGGMVMTLLDEVMAYAASTAGWRGLTAEATTRFRNPVPVGVPLTLRGRVLWQRRNVVGVAGEVLDAAGTLLASAEGKFVGKGRIDPGTFGALRRRPQ